MRLLDFDLALTGPETARFFVVHFLRFETGKVRILIRINCTKISYYKRNFLSSGEYYLSYLKNRRVPCCLFRSPYGQIYKL